MHSIWSGALSFGLVNIPVQLYSGTIEHSFDLDMLHKKDLSPIRYAKICKAEEVEIPYNQIVKGYEYQKGEYIILTDEDFQRVNQKKSKNIEILFFTYEQEIDSIYFEKVYYLQPDKGAAKAYSLLLEALNRSEKVAIVSFVLRSHMHIGVIKTHGNLIILNQLRFQTEIRPTEEFQSSLEKNNSKELGMAIQLIDQLTETFNPQAFKDSYHEELQTIIDEKMSGIKPKKGKAKTLQLTQANDIMSKLKASLDISHSKKVKSKAIPKKLKK